PGIKAQDLIVQAVGRNHLAILSQYQIVESVLGTVLWRVARQQFARGIEMEKLRPSGGFKAIRPHRAVRRVQPYPEHRQKSVTIPGHKIRSEEHTSELQSPCN